MRKFSILFLLTISAFCINVNSQILNPPNPIEQGLASEYHSLLLSNIQNFQKDLEIQTRRLNEIEELSLNNNFYTLREFIAQSFFWDQPHRINQLPQNGYKYLEKNIKANWFSSVPLAFYFAMNTEYQDEFIKLLEEKFSETNNSLLGRALGLIYLQQRDNAKAATLIPSYRKMLGVRLSEDLKILSFENETAVDFLQKDDRLLKINDAPLSKIDDISTELENYKEGSSQEITFQRNGTILRKSFIVPQNKVLIWEAAFNAFNYFNSEDYEASISLAMEALNTYDTKEVYSQNEKYLEAEIAGIKYVLCTNYLNPINKNLIERRKGLNLCEEALETYERVFGNTQQTDYFFTNKNLIQSDPFHATVYNNLIRILSQSYLKDRLNYGLGLEIEEINPQKSLDLIKRNPLLNSADHKKIIYAVGKIFTYGIKDNFKNQFEHVSTEVIDILESLSALDNYEGALARFYLQAIYNYSTIHKNYEKGFKVRLTSYEFNEGPLAIIKLATSYTFAYGVEKNNDMTQKLLEEVFTKYSEEELQKYDQNEVIWAYNQLSYLYFIKEEYSKAFELVKNKIGTNERIDTLISSLVLDSHIDVSQDYLDQVLELQKTKEIINELDLEEYVAYKFYHGIEPFYEDTNRACSEINNSTKQLTNIGKQLTWLCSDLTFAENSQAKEYLLELSMSGSSLATAGLAFLYSEEEDIKNLEIAKSYAIKAKTQLENNTSKDLSDNISWLLDNGSFNVNEKFLKSISEDIDASIKRYEDYQLALKTAQLEEEKKRVELIRKQEQESLARLRAQKRKEALEKGGNFIFDVLEFTLKAALVVGAVALAGEAIEDSSPEVKQALADSLSSSFSGSSYSSKSSSYQCQNARSKLSSARTAFNTSRSLTGNLSCNNVGPSCLTPLPAQCSNRASSCRPGDYGCTSRENNNFFNCQQRARQAAQRKKASCDAYKQQLQNQCNLRVDNNKRSSAQNSINAAQREVNLYCY